MRGQVGRGQEEGAGGRRKEVEGSRCSVEGRRAMPFLRSRSFFQVAMRNKLVGTYQRLWSVCVCPSSCRYDDSGGLRERRLVYVISFLVWTTHFSMNNRTMIILIYSQEKTRNGQKKFRANLN